MFSNSASKERKNKSHFPRYRQIAMVLAKYRLEEVLKYVGIKNYALVGWMLRGNPFRKMVYTKPERTRMAIEELGTTFVKLGQILSTRADLLPSVPTLVTGSLHTVRKSGVMKLGNTSTEVINLLLYAFRSPAALKYLPWEDESPEEFKERSKIFGLK